MMVCILSAWAGNARSDGILKGRLVDEEGQPVEFANVIVTDAGGKAVRGGVADADGAFAFEIPDGEYTLDASSVGYKPVSLKCGASDLGEIRMPKDVEMLAGATVQAVIPKVKLTGEGLQTSVRGTVLENIGTANDVLARTPGLIRGRNGLEVIGKGSPMVYVNGRRLTDASELDRLLSSEIQSVEVITNPGAQYDASVRAVVRIRTVRRQGEGFGFDAGAADEQSLRKAEGNDPSGYFNGNYRIRNVDIFAGVNALKWTSRQTSDLYQETLGSPVYTQDGDLIGDYLQKTAGVNGGVNWQIADNHSIGAKVDLNTNLSVTQHQVLNEDLLQDGTVIDRISAVGDFSNGGRKPRTLAANAYYNGVAGKLGIDFNADYFSAEDFTEAVTNETSDMTQDAVINTESQASNRLYATKLVLSYPIWKGQLQAGTEETFSRREDRYSLSSTDLTTSSSQVREDNFATFATYAFAVGKVGQISAGLRYEHVDYAYDDAGGEGSFTRRYDNFFPTFSFAGALGKVQTIVNYSVKTARPDFSMLSSAIRYNSRYAYQSGNAGLQPQTIADLSVTAVWKSLSLIADYSRIDNLIAIWSEPVGDQAVVMVRPRNLNEPFRMLATYLVFAPTVGNWTLNYTAGVQKQWLTIEAHDRSQASGVRSISFNDKPMFFAQINNTLTVKGGWQFELGGEIHSKGYTSNIFITNTFLNVSAAIQKSLLRDGSLVLRLQGDDMAGMANSNVMADFGSYITRQDNIMDTQRVKFSVRYRFNSAASKYRGTGAGRDARDRM